MKLWLTRQANGMYMLTALRPVIEGVGRTPRQDAYVRAGDPVGYRHLCQAFVHMALPDFEDIPALTSVRVEMPQWNLLSEKRNAV